MKQKLKDDEAAFEALLKADRAAIKADLDKLKADLKAGL